MSKRILVLSGTGMLGSMMVQVLREKKLKVETTRRDRVFPEMTAGWRFFNARDFVYLPSVGTLDFLREFDWIINCIGITKPVIDQDPDKGKKNAIEINALFPHLLARNLSNHQRLIQIATDCAFSGRTGNYTEDSPHDAEDAYGKTKSLGEVNLPNVMHLRCSIIGPEPRTEKRFLLEWLLGQPKGSEVPGYINHSWNGTTTLAFARLCAGIIRSPQIFRSEVQHVVPDHGDNKATLLQKIAHAFGRNDLSIREIVAPQDTDRTLSTSHRKNNLILWAEAGYSAPPTIMEMLVELAEYQKKKDFAKTV